ncbi:MAG: hypothetical protein Q9165_005361 [Trypethelium subeluteriae]
MSDEIYASRVGRNATEQQQIDQQFQIVTTALGWLLHPSITSALPPFPHIADIATGTGIFLRTLAASHPTATLDSYDISPSMLPDPAQTPLAPNITLTTANAKHPFPTSLHSTYNLVHVHYLVAALDPADWAPVLAHLLALLKPGGAIQWVEPGLDRYHHHLRGEPSSHAATLTRLSAAFFGGRLRERVAPDAGWAVLLGLMREAGCVCVEQDVVSTDRVPELRRAVTENAAVVMLRFVGMMGERGEEGGWRGRS